VPESIPLLLAGIKVIFGRPEQEPLAPLIAYANRQDIEDRYSIFQALGMPMPPPPDTLIAYANYFEGDERASMLRMLGVEVTP
jgi:hypothetical protein